MKSEMKSQAKWKIFRMCARVREFSNEADFRGQQLQQFKQKKRRKMLQKFLPKGFILGV